MGLVLAVVVAHEVIVRASDGSTRLTLGEDFVPVYAAGTLVRQGRSAELYAIEPIARIEHRVVAEADLEPLPVYGPFFNPPFFAAFYAPLSALPYRSAAVVWLGLNLFFLCAAIVLLVRMLPAGCGWTCWGLVPLLVVLPLPFWQAMCHQQNTFLSLLLLSVVVTFWRSAAVYSQLRNLDSILAGLSAGLLFYKPHLGLALSAVLVLSLGWRAALGLAIAGIALLLFTVVAMPGSLGEYVHRMPGAVAWMQSTLPYNWGRQITPGGFWRLALQGRAIGPTGVPARMLGVLTNVATGCVLAWVAFRIIRKRRPVDSDSLIIATIVSIPLLMPYFMDYDMLLLAIPATLLGGQWVQSQRRLMRADSIAFWAWVALFLAMYVNPALSWYTRVNIAVPLVAFVWALSIRKCLSPQVEPARLTRYDETRFAIAA